MKQTRISPQIVQVTHFGLVNCFLVDEPDGLTLVDTGIKGCGRAIHRAAAATNRPLRRVLLTHSHADHVGALDQVTNVVSGMEVAIGRREVRLLEGDMGLEPGEPTDKIRGSFVKLQTVPSILLDEGDRYGSLEVIFTPGHTPGHLALLDPRSGTILAGDAVASIGGLRVVGDCSKLFPLPNFGTWHKATALNSARKIADLRPVNLAMGHGKPLLGNATEGLREAIRHAEQSYAGK
ncbi:MBL fold metallo-hydrolase [Silvibacterium acidisoli]|uniref:MBL fold metallo-hydrolase n=1 Tax=Acidobacteriaceae bacterium ZG23-2 TaxID=2883246 RepID=UPI00406CA74A